MALGPLWAALGPLLGALGRSWGDPGYAQTFSGALTVVATNASAADAAGEGVDLLVRPCAGSLLRHVLPLLRRVRAFCRRGKRRFPVRPVQRLPVPPVLVPCAARARSDDDPGCGSRGPAGGLVSVHGR